MDTIGTLTLAQIVELKIQYLLQYDNYNIDNIDLYNKGVIKAYKEMRKDMKEMSEIEFTQKYSSILKNIHDQSKDKNISVEEDEEMCGYDNGIVNVLICIDPKFRYEMDYIY